MLVAFHLNNEVSELVRAVEEELVWDASGDAHDVASGKLLTSSALNGTVTLFMWSNSLPIQIGSAHQERCGTGLHEKDIDLGFVPFDLAVCFPVDQQDSLVGEIRKLFHGKMMRIGRGLRSQSLPDSPQVGRGPVLEPFGRYCLRGKQQGCGQQGAHEKFLHFAHLGNLFYLTM